MINPQNGDEECFKWAIIAADKWMDINSYPERVLNLTEFANNHDWSGLEFAADKWMDINSYPERVLNLTEFANNHDWSGLEFPDSIKEIGKFEVKNGISVKVLRLEGKDIYIHINSNYDSNQDPQGSWGCYTREINLLMISMNGTNHYMAIKSLNRLLSSSNSKDKDKQYFCTNCQQGFSLEVSRDQNQVYCKDNKAIRVEMPLKGETIEFCNGQNQFKVPFMIYYHLEALLSPPLGGVQAPTKDPWVGLHQRVPNPNEYDWSGLRVSSFN